MAELILITGGCRSGKSAFAMKTAGKSRALYIATAEPLDCEMRLRIRNHKKQRPGSWTTVEEPVQVARAIRRSPAGTIIVDCLTLWVSNLLAKRKDFSESRAAKEAVRLASACGKGKVILVTNEVGLGIVPADPQTRLYRDCLGRVNQVLARRADKVFFMVSGIPVRVK